MLLPEELETKTFQLQPEQLTLTRQQSRNKVIKICCDFSDLMLNTIDNYKS